MARKSAKFGSHNLPIEFGDSCNGVGAAVRVPRCRCPWLRWLPRQVTCRPDFRAHSAQDHESLGPPCYQEGATVRTRSGVGGPPPLPRKGRSFGNSTLRLGAAYSHLPPRDGCVRMPAGPADRRRTAPVWRHARPTALMSTSTRERFSIRAFAFSSTSFTTANLNIL
jgi:hypothetical protein